MAAGDERRKDAVILSRVRRVRRRLNSVVELEAAVVPAWCFATALALWRFAAQRWVWQVGVAMALVAAAVWWWLARRRAVTLAEAAVVADRRAGADGLLLTRLEVPVGAWELALNQRVRELTLPPIDVRRPAGLVMLAALFLAVALWVPAPKSTTRAVNAVAAEKLDDLQEKRDAVAREEPADPALEKELQRLREVLHDGTFDAADWEAADQLAQALDQKAREAASELSRTEAAAKSLEEAMGTAQNADAATRERDELEQALMALSDGAATDGEQAMNQALGESSPQGQNGQEGQNGHQGQNGQPGHGPSKAQVSDLRRALQQRQQQLAQRYGQGTGQQQAGRGQGQGERQGQPSGEQGQGRADGDTRSNRRGRGGTGHGWAPPQELTFGDAAQLDPDRLKFERLPEGHGGDADELWGLRGANPRPTSGVPVGAGTSVVASGSRAPATREGAVLPRNRELIKRYFDTQP